MRPTSVLSASIALAALALISACRSTSPVLAPTLTGLDSPPPDSFVVRFTTTKGDFDVMVHRDWAPLGAARAYWLVRSGYYDGARFFRAVPNFVVQFGLAADPKVTAVMRERRIRDDSVTRSNVRGTMSFASAGPNTRTAQLFISLNNNQRLDPRGFAVFGQVVAGMEVVDSLYQGYGEGAPRGKGPSQERITSEGEAYLVREFSLLDQIRKAEVVKKFWGRGRAD